MSAAPFGHHLRKSLALRQPMPVIKDVEGEEPPKKWNWKLIATLAVFVGMIVAAAVFHQAVSHLLHIFMAWCEGLGWISVVLVAVMTCVLSLLMLPTFPLMVGAGLLFPRMYGTAWGEVTGCASVFAGLWSGSMCAFVLGRTFFKDWAEGELKRYAWMVAVNSMVEEQGWWIVLVARMSPLLPAEVFNYACSLTPITVQGYGVGCFGSLVPVCFWVLSTAAASSAASGEGSSETGFLIVIINVVVLVFLSVVLGTAFRKYRKRTDCAVEDIVDQYIAESGIAIDEIQRRKSMMALRKATASFSLNPRNLEENVFGPQIVKSDSRRFSEHFVRRGGSISDGIEGDSQDTRVKRFASVA
eukprot:TRINITY_DN67913_c0_g1_i1.p1 TRINITY_DN67913_c0_g1~~TRINITY_DN67913_c0_g1_i1.p1  ORF type:complete len:417 (-),score=74.46 TRINITY_DN67913_c0_g1_i1:34-1104(-)